MLDSLLKRSLLANLCCNYIAVMVLAAIALSLVFVNTPPTPLPYGAFNSENKQRNRTCVYTISTCRQKDMACQCSCHASCSTVRAFILTYPAIEELADSVIIIKFQNLLTQLSRGSQNPTLNRFVTKPPSANSQAAWLSPLLTTC